MRDRARDDALHARLSKEREAFDAAFEIGHQAIKLGGYQLAFEIPCGRLTIPADMRGAGFIRANQHAICLLAEIGMRPRIAHDGQFTLERDQLLDRLGDQIMMQHIGDRHIMSGPRAYDITIRACGIDDMLADDVAVIGDHFPLARGQELDISDEGAAVDFRAELARACGHRIGNVGRGDMAIGNGVERGLHAIGIEERVNLFDLFRPDDMGFIARELRDAIDLLEPIDLFIRAGKPQTPAAMPADGMAREFFELRIKLGAIHMHLGHIE